MWQYKDPREQSNIWLNQHIGPCIAHVPEKPFISINISVQSYHYNIMLIQKKNHFLDPFDIWIIILCLQKLESPSHKSNGAGEEFFLRVSMYFHYLTLEISMTLHFNKIWIPFTHGCCMQRLVLDKNIFKFSHILFSLFL